MKKNYFAFLTLLVLLTYGNRTNAQDIHFSQYMQTPQLLNPALTGAQTVFRATLIYKDQWRSVTVPYSTYGVSVENRFKNKHAKEVEGKNLPGDKSKTFRRFAAGLSFYNDKAGDGNMSHTQVNLSASGFVPTGDNSALSGGLQASYIQRSVDFSKLIFPDQYTGTGYDSNTPNMESANNQNFSYADFAGGVNWNYGFTESLKEADAKFKANIGAAVYHFSKPKQEFLIGQKDKLEMKYNFYGDFLFGLRNPNWALAPSILCMFQGPSIEMIEGLMIKYYFIEGPRYYGVKASSSIGFGISYRNKDAAIASFLFEYGHYAFGVSYDLNSSILRTASKVQGGPEIFLRYVAPNQFAVDHKPKRRYNLK